VWLAAPIAAAVVFFVPVPARLVDRWVLTEPLSHHRALGDRVTNRVPFAVLDVMIVLATVLVLYRIVRPRRAGAHWTAGPGFDRGISGSPRGGRHPALVCRGLGPELPRLPIETTLGAAPPPALDVAALRSAVVSSNALAARFVRSGPAPMRPTFFDLAGDLSGPINEALASLGRVPLGRSGVVPKSSVLLTPFFTAAGVNGMINPLALESIVHPELTPAERGFVLAHEWAHLAGYADEPRRVPSAGWHA
jgi:hypothetical protein